MKPDARTHLPTGIDTQTQIINVPFVDLMTENGIGTQALYGQRFDVMSLAGGIAKGALYSIVYGMERIDYIGEIPVTSLSATPILPTHIVSAVSATVFKDANIKSRLLGTLPRNAALEGSVEGDFLNVGQLGFIHLRHLRQIGRATPRSMIDHAVDMLELPYVWGGTGGIGVDCSGLVQSALAATGVDCPRDADQQEAQLGQAVTYADRKAGDLLFWPGHVGIVIQGDQILHANAFHMCVAVEDVTAAVARIGDVRSVKRL